MATFNCAYCGKPANKPAGAVNRAKAIGLNLYCDRVCAGFGRRKGKTHEQRVAEKAAYDAEYRVKNAARLKAKKAAYHARTYDPARQREYNQRRMPHHIEYCRRPEYKSWKREYDAQRRASEYGPYADAFRLTLAIQRECLSRLSRYEIDLANGKLGKSKKRRREYDRLVGNQSKDRPLGNPERHQGRPDASITG